MESAGPVTTTTSGRTLIGKNDGANAWGVNIALDYDDPASIQRAHVVGQGLGTDLDQIHAIFCGFPGLGYHDLQLL
jgi:hypothetical protein